MPLRGGESVGQAYVRIYGDGSSMPHDIRRALEESEPSVREGGKGLGRTFGDEFDKESRKTFKTQFGDTKKSMYHDLNKGLTESIAKLDLSRRYFDSPEWKKFLRRLDDEFGDAGKLAGRRLEAEFRDSADLTNLSDRMRRVGHDVRRAQADILTAMHEDALRMNKAFNARVREQQTETDLAFRKSVRDNKAAIVQFRNNMRELAAEIAKLERGESKFGHRRLDRMVNDLRRLAPNLDLSTHEIDLFNDRLDVMGRHLDHTNPRISSMHRRLTTLGDGMGRLFGKGSRNNFLNFFGSFVAMLIKFPTSVLSKVFSTLTNFGRSISEAFVKGGGGLSGTMDAFAKGLAGVAIGLANVVAAAIAFVAFIILLSTVVGPIVAVVSMLVGILLALASSLIYAAFSAAAFLPLIIPLAGIIMGTVAAVLALKDAGGALGRQLDRIKDQATDLWDGFKKGILESKGLGEVLDEVSRLLGRMDPLFDAAVKGFNRFADSIADEMKGGAFDSFIARFTRFLPHAMNDLGDIFGNIFGGLAGILRASIPLANRLLDNLVDITDRFDKWANSKKGQREIKAFLDDAADSASAVADFIQGAWHWLGELISRSKETGDTLWTRIGGQFQEWADYIDKHPKAFEDWMEDAEEFATAIGHAVDGVNELVDVLDSPRNREIGKTLVSGLGDVLSILGDIFSLATDTNLLLQVIMNWDGISNLVDSIWEGIKDFGRGVWYILGGAWVGDLFDGIADGFRGAPDFLKGQLDGLLSGPKGNAVMAIKTSLDLSGVIEGLGVMKRRIARGISEVVSTFRGLDNRAAKAVGDLAGRVMARFSPLRDRVQTVIDQLVARFGNVGERIGRTIGDLWGQISSRFTSVIAQVAHVIDDIVALFRGLAGRILAMIGPIVIHPTIGSILGGGGGSKHPGNTSNPDDLSGGAPDSLIPPYDPAIDPRRIVMTGGPGPLPMPMGPERIDMSGWQIVSQSKDPRIVAVEVVNELIARAV